MRGGNRYYLGNYARKLFAEVWQTTKPEMIVATLLALAAYGYKYQSGGFSWQDAKSVLFPPLWVACVLGSYYGIKVAVHLRREDIAAWKDYKPIIHLPGDFSKGKKPSLYPALALPTIPIVIFGSIAYLTIHPQPAQVTGVAKPSSQSLSSQLQTAPSTMPKTQSIPAPNPAPSTTSSVAADRRLPDLVFLIAAESAYHDFRAPSQQVGLFTGFGIRIQHQPVLPVDDIQVFLTAINGITLQSNLPSQLKEQQRGNEVYVELFRIDVTDFANGGKGLPDIELSVLDAPVFGHNWNRLSTEQPYTLTVQAAYNNKVVERHIVAQPLSEGSSSFYKLRIKD